MLVEKNVFNTCGVSTCWVQGPFAKGSLQIADGNQTLTAIATIIGRRRWGKRFDKIRIYLFI